MRKMVKIVHGANRETEMSRANKPVMYLDFDGVLNAFPNTGIVNYSDVGHVELVPDPGRVPYGPVFGEKGVPAGQDGGHRFRAARFP